MELIEPTSKKQMELIELAANVANCANGAKSGVFDQSW